MFILFYFSLQADLSPFSHNKIVLKGNLFYLHHVLKSHRKSKKAVLCLCIFFYNLNNNQTEFRKTEIFHNATKSDSCI